jgi:hypothetical protein
MRSMAEVILDAWDGKPPSGDGAHWLVSLDDGSDEVAEWHSGQWWFPGNSQGFDPEAVKRSHRYRGRVPPPEAAAVADAYLALRDAPPSRDHLADYTSAKAKLERACVAYLNWQRRSKQP